MKNRRLLQIIVLIIFGFCLRAVTAQAASLTSRIYQIVPTETPYRTSTPVHNWNQPPGLTPTLTPNLFTQTSQAQLTQTAQLLITETVTPSFTATETLTSTPAESTSTPTPSEPEPTATRQIVGEGRLLISTDRYDRNNYWAIPLGLISTLALIAAGILILTKRH